MINAIKQTAILFGYLIIWVLLFALYCGSFALNVAVEWMHRKLDDLCDRILKI